MTYWGGIEAGGTKFVVGICDHEGTVLDRKIIRTGKPGETVEKVTAYFHSRSEDYPLNGIGLASFGPLDLDRSSETYGSITSTPKEHWRNFNIKEAFEESLQRSIPFDTDVNAAVLAEHLWGAARGKQNAVYLTVGTGIGGGILANGAVIHGLLHPEIGHMKIRSDDLPGAFSGVCPYHNYCLEGLASGRALQERWGKPGPELEEDHPGWELEARVLARGIVNIILVISPEIVILGGGVMNQDHLFPRIRHYVKEELNGYIQKREIRQHISGYIVPPALGNDVGLLGAAAIRILEENEHEALGHGGTR